MTAYTNDSDRANNGSKDVSISNVPLVGKRDSIEIRKQLSDGSTEATTYRNAYTWTASDSWLENTEQWLAIRTDHGYQAFVTYAASRLWVKLAIALTLVIPTLGYLMLFAFVVGLGSLCYVALRSPSTLAASSLRLLMIAIACI